MAAADFSLVVGMQSTEESLGIRMGRFSLDIGQLSDNHPIEGTIPVYERSGFHLANTTVRVSLVYDTETPRTSATEMPFSDLGVNLISSSEDNCPVNVVSLRGNLLADARDKFRDTITKASPQRVLSWEFDVPSTGRRHPFPGSANSNHLMGCKPLTTDVELPSQNKMQMMTLTAIQSPRKQLVFDVEIPLKRELVNLDLKPTSEDAVTSSEEAPRISPKGAQLSPQRGVKSKKQRHTTLSRDKAESSAKFSWPRSSSHNRIRSRSPKRRAVNARSGQQSGSEGDLQNSPQAVSGQTSEAKTAVVDMSQSGKTTRDSKRSKTSGKVPPNPQIHSKSSPQKSFQVRQKSPVPSSTTSKINTSRSEAPPRSKHLPAHSLPPNPKAKTETSSKPSWPSEEGENGSLNYCDIHNGSQENTSPEFDLVKEQRQLDSPDRHSLSGNLANLPQDLVDKYLEGIPAGQGKDASLYRESVQKLIHQIVTLRGTLNISSNAWTDGCVPSSENDKLNKTQSTTLINRFKQLDENVGSVNRLLTSLLTENNVDLPQYARVAQTEILEDDPRFVVEAALLEELFFPKSESEMRGPSILNSTSEEAREPWANKSKVHNGGPPKKQVFAEGLPLRNCQHKRTVSKVESTKPLLDLCQHGYTQEQSDNITAFDLCLTLKVGKLILSKSTLTEPREFPPALSEGSEGWGVKQDLKSCSCLLTISFPGLNHTKNVSPSVPEQSITISPTQLDSSELYFGNESQLHWKNVKVQSLEMWKSEKLMVRAFLRWDSGQSLTCEGRVVLEEVFSLTPTAFQTELHLFRSGKEGAVSGSGLAESSTGLECCSKEPAALMAQVKSTPAARLEISIDLQNEDSSGEGAWLYVTVPCVTGSKLQPYKGETTGHLLLIVKSDLRSICKIPFHADWSASPGCEVKAWRPLKGSNPDGILRGPKQMDKPTMFIEVWSNRGENELALELSPKNLIGLVKVPLKCSSNLTKGNDGSFPVAEGDYYIWNPFKDVLCGSIEIRVVMGSEAQMLKLLQQNRAARITQSNAPSPKAGSQAVKHISSSVAENNPFRDRNFPKDYQRKMVKHVIEVTVQHATDLPETAVYAQSEGTYMKYIFPCDEQAFYSQTMEWSKTIHFCASVHHGIILPTGQRLENHFTTMNESTAKTGDLIFELWGCYASLSCEQVYPPNILQLSDSGAVSGWDMGREPSCKHGGRDSKPRERLIGTAKLLQWSLLGLMASKPASVPEVRKRFYLPINLDSSLLSGAYIRAPSLAVEVAYFILDEENRKDYVQGTIFSEVNISEDALFQGVVEFDIIDSAGLQDTEKIYVLNRAKYLTNGVNSYVRYSLFPSNAELALRYPPYLTPIQPNSCFPLYEWTGRLKIVLNVQVLKELKSGHMSFEVWHHHFPQARRSVNPLVPRKDSLTTDIWLGTALIPTRTLWETRQGIVGWYDLTARKGQKVGAINVQVYFKQWQVRPLSFTRV